ncbi:TPA: phage tail assembly protein [Klebsiella pneumoniae]|uniref:phage tail assembly protein n=1 Tax=Klebsiella pneumoniae TaxID=573 RepID=UPI000E2EADC1|nr:phage tail assembly protein [Klebsiella pneumoniae]HBR1366669.1 phage tail assembly protein [Klebsiella pneumoniae]HBR2015004.1 phage tail assembly protein [Klebsiella pneumoniae]
MSKKNDNVITLIQPIVRRDKEIAQIEITDAIKQAGSLRGLNLIRVANLDADSVTTLLTRVTSPALTQKEIGEMHTLDFISAAEKLVPFLNPPDAGKPAPEETAAE